MKMSSFSPSARDRLACIQSALYDAGRVAIRLAVAVDRMEKAFADFNSDIDLSRLNVLCDDAQGLSLPFELPDPEGQPVRIKAQIAAIKLVLELRRSIDKARSTLVDVAPLIDGTSESMDARWSVRIDGDLRRVRGDILRGHTRDFFPAACPMVGAGVPDALREGSQRLADHFEALKSVISLSEAKTVPGQSEGDDQAHSDAEGGSIPGKKAGPHPPTADDLRPAAWFSGHTREALYPSLLRVAVRENRLRASKKVSSRWHHSISEVCEHYPVYSEKLRKAEQGETGKDKEKESEGGASEAKN